MKKNNDRLWNVNAEAHYARHLTTCSASVATQTPHDQGLSVPPWITGDKTLHLVLSTAFSLQPKRWSFGVADSGDTQ